MTYDEITLWRRFMRDKGQLNNFEFMFRNHKLSDLDFDAYLEATEPEDVMLHAFDMAACPNTMFDFKYWNELNKKWMERWTRYKETGDLKLEEYIRCQHCGRSLPNSSFALNPKGMPHKHCMECESGEWDRQRKEQEKAEKEREQKTKEILRLEKEVRDKQLAIQARTAALGKGTFEKTTKVCSHCGRRMLRSEFYKSDTSEDGLQSWCKSCQRLNAKEAEEAQGKVSTQQEAPRAPAQQETPKQPAQPTPAPTRKEVQKAEPKRVTYGPRLGEHDATLHWKATTNAVILNTILSDEVRRQELTRCYLSNDRSGGVYLIFNKLQGANVTANGSATGTLRVNSVEICRQLAEHFKLEYNDTYYLHISKNKSRQDGVMTIQVVHTRTVEEYIAIAERRKEEAEEALNGQKDEAPVASENPAQAKAPEKASVKAPEKPAPKKEEKPGGTPTDILDRAVQDGLLTENDIATWLFRRGWKLQKQKVVTTYEDFKI